MATQHEHSTVEEAVLEHPGARPWSPRWGRIGALLTLFIPLAMLILGWSLRGLPNLPLPQTRPGRLPEAHWETRAALPTPRVAFGLAVADGRIWLIGGDAATGDTGEAGTAIYDPLTDRWAEGPPPVAAVRSPRAVALADTIYVVGGRAAGQRATDAAAALDPRTGAWRGIAPLPAPRADHAVVALDGRLYAIGGGAGGAPAGTTDRYDPAADRWEALPAPPTPRDGLAAVALGGRIYAIGGRVTGAPSTVVEVFDPRTGAWSAGTPLLAPLADFDAVALAGRIHALRGEVQQVYDARADRWLTGVVPTNPRLDVGLAAVDDSLYAVGGVDGATGAAVGVVDVLVPGPASEPEPFKAVGIDRGGAIAVVAGLLVTITLMAVMLRVGRRRPTRDEDDPGPEEAEVTGERPADANDPDAEVAPPVR